MEEVKTLEGYGSIGPNKYCIIVDTRENKMIAMLKDTDFHFRDCVVCTTALKVGDIIICEIDSDLKMEILYMIERKTLQDFIDTMKKQDRMENINGMSVACKKEGIKSVILLESFNKLTQNTRTQASGEIVPSKTHLHLSIPAQNLLSMMNRLARDNIIWYSLNLANTLYNLSHLIYGLKRESTNPTYAPRTIDSFCIRLNEATEKLSVYKGKDKTNEITKSYIELDFFVKKKRAELLGGKVIKTHKIIKLYRGMDCVVLYDCEKKKAIGLEYYFDINMFDLSQEIGSSVFFKREKTDERYLICIAKRQYNFSLSITHFSLDNFRNYLLTLLEDGLFNVCMRYEHFISIGDLMTYVIPNQNVADEEDYYSSHITSFHHKNLERSTTIICTFIGLVVCHFLAMNNIYDPSIDLPFYIKGEFPNFHLIYYLYDSKEWAMHFLLPQLNNEILKSEIEKKIQKIISDTYSYLEIFFF